MSKLPLLQEEPSRLAHNFLLNASAAAANLAFTDFKPMFRRRAFSSVESERASDRSGVLLNLAIRTTRELGRERGEGVREGRREELGSFLFLYCRGD